MIALGSKARDRVSGFSGVITANEETRVQVTADPDTVSHVPEQGV